MEWNFPNWLNSGGKLLTCDDRTGIIYEVADGKHVYARYILSNGDGNRAKGFKCEWMTVKDGLLYVGSTGKEWTTAQGVVLNQDPRWVKVPRCVVLSFYVFASVSGFGDVLFA